MSTVRDLITDAMFAAGVLGQGDALADDDAELVRRRLIRMVDRWANENLMVYTTGNGSFPMVAGTAALMVVPGVNRRKDSCRIF